MPKTKIEVRPRDANGKTVYDIWEHTTEANGAMSSGPRFESAKASTCTQQIANLESEIEQLGEEIAARKRSIDLWQQAKTQIEAAEMKSAAVDTVAAKVGRG